MAAAPTHVKDHQALQTHKRVTNSVGNRVIQHGKAYLTTHFKVGQVRYVSLTNVSPTISKEKVFAMVRSLNGA